MLETKPRDVQVLPIGTDTTVLRSRSWTRLRFEIEYGLGRGTTANSYVIKAEKQHLLTRRENPLLKFFWRRCSSA
jgi:flavorubredoxin